MVTLRLASEHRAAAWVGGRRLALGLDDDPEQKIFNPVHLLVRGCALVAVVPFRACGRADERRGLVPRRALGLVAVAKREVEICKQLDDPNILRIIDSETDPKGRPYLATEYRPRG
jgi:hypothetical protein